MQGRNPRQAVEAFLDPLKETISCLARTKITLSPGGWATPDRTHALTVNSEQPIKLRSEPALMLRIGMLYAVIPSDKAGERWRVSTRGYAYEMQTSSGELVWSYHWHPTTRVTNPHAHLGHTQLAEHAVLHQKAHNPTGRVSLESVIRACITEYDATPLRDDWEKTLEQQELDFHNRRSWS